MAEKKDTKKSSKEDKERKIKGKTGQEVIDAIERGIDSRKSSRKIDAVKQGLRGAGKVAKQAALTAIPGGQLYTNIEEMADGVNMTKEAFQDYMNASKKRKPSTQESELVRQIPKDKNPNAAPNINAEYNKGGIITNKGIGASMKPHNVFGKKK
jgi:hypothetical protein